MTVNSAGKYLGKNLDSENSIVVSNAGGIVAINVKDSVDATTRAGGKIDVYGDPNDRKFKKIIGGKINFK
ncbi:GIN domain-containing protein [Chryseobacterium sp. MP_3.2]|uniref:GIN domain-containing protein n=1 Tax=Chryseobacterium sp. MP_3.2 TaxID=3071712 RepID=UPI002E1440EF